MALNILGSVLSNADESCLSPRNSGDHNRHDMQVAQGQQHGRRYIKHTTILNSSLRQPRYRQTPANICGSSEREDICGSSEDPEHENHLRANTWFLRAKKRLSAGRNFANVLKD